MAQVVARIVVAQAGNPAPGGYTDGSRDDVTVGDLVTLTNADNNGAKVHRWTISPYYPAGTLAGLSVTGDGTDTCELTPDVAGDISVTLTVQGDPLPDGRANIATQTITLGIRATFAGYAPGLPLPHPLEGGKGTSAAVDRAVGNAGRVAETLYALSQGSPGGGGGVTTLTGGGGDALSGNVTLTGVGVAFYTAGNNIEISATGGATSPDPDVDEAIVIDLDDAVGAASISNNSGVGTVFTLTSQAGTGAIAMGTPCPFGDGMSMADARYWTNTTGGSVAKTYQPTVTNFTMSAWVKVIVPTGAGQSTFWGKEGASTPSYALGYDVATNQPLLMLTTAGGGYAAIAGEIPLSPGEWSHVVATYDGANVTIYVNGIASTPVAHTGTITYDNTKSHFVGNLGAGTGYVARNFRLATGVRTLAEIKAIYESGRFGTSAAINATKIQNINVDAAAPVADMVLQADSPTAVGWRTPTAHWRISDFVAADSTATTVAAAITAGHLFVLARNYELLGWRFRWAAASGTPNCTLELWDGAGSVIATATQAVTTTPTTYDVLLGSPLDLSTYKGQDLIASVFQATGTNYFKAGLSLPTTTPVPAGLGVLSKGSIFSAGHVLPATATAVALGVDPILRLK